MKFATRTLVLVAFSTLMGSVVVAQNAPTTRDTRPIHSYAALPQRGNMLPVFAFPTTAGREISNTNLRGTPTVLAFWSTWCGASRALLKGIELLHAQYAPRGVRVIVLADNSLPELKQFMDSVGVTVEIAAAPTLQQVFDQSSHAPERDSVRVAWALPLFLVVDADGRVAMRDGGPAFPQIRKSLDSLLRK